MIPAIHTPWEPDAWRAALKTAFRAPQALLDHLGRALRIGDDPLGENDPSIRRAPAAGHPAFRGVPGALASYLPGHAGRAAGYLLPKLVRETPGTPAKSIVSEIRLESPTN